MNLAGGKRRFLVCGREWNNRDLQIGEGQERLLWKRYPLEENISLLLEKTLGWDEIRGKEDNKNNNKGSGKTERNAELIVLVPRDADPPFTLDDLAFFSRRLPGKRKKVLYIHTVGAPAFFDEPFQTDWLFCIHRAGFDVEELKKWLQPKKVERANQESQVDAWSRWKNVRLSHLGKRSQAKVGKTPCNFLFQYKKIEGSVSASGYRLLKGEACTYAPTAAMFYSLLRISGKHAKLEHDFLSAISQGGIDQRSKQESRIKKAFIDFCTDMRGALAPSDDFKYLKQNKVLLIDDRPDLVEREIRTIIGDYLAPLTLAIWPTNESNDLNILDIAQYNSVFSAARDISESEIPLRGENGNQIKLNLKDTLAKTRFILVDILFDGTDGDNEELGYAVIRGLRRIFHDYQKEIGGKDWALPKIIAISRSDDLRKAQQAYLAGASEYIVKSRLLSLPCVLKSNRCENLESVGDMHRNFHLLYNLTHNSTRLLRTTFIPPSLPFHGTPTRSPEPNTMHTREKALPMARLLSFIPKTDLHVHVGSCMTPEFLIVASLVMLLRRDPDNDGSNPYLKAIQKLIEVWNVPNTEFSWQKGLQVCEISSWISPSVNCDDGMRKWAGAVRDYLKKQIDFAEKHMEDYPDDLQIRNVYQHFRSILHNALSISDHLDKSRLKKAIDGKKELVLFLFAMTHAGPGGKPLMHDQDDVLRIFLLFQAARDDKCILRIGQVEVLYWFRSSTNMSMDSWRNLRDLFYPFKNNQEPRNEPPFSTPTLRKRNWSLFKCDERYDIEVDLKRQSDNRDLDLLSEEPKYENDPIGYLLASGTRCSNLDSYLAGCEFSGAEHLRHPFLIHLYAQQVVYNFVRQGVMYAELRAAITGYENQEINFTAQDACNCMIEAFRNAQQKIVERYTNVDKLGGDKPVWLWKAHFVPESLFRDFDGPWNSKRFPVKVSLILTGKRHKATRQMLKEAAAATVLHTLPPTSPKTAAEFVRDDMTKCRVVGFDLAGPEDGNPPRRFRDEYEQIAKLHIPITVHAGENATADFVESAVLDLRARRLGHGLSIVDDKSLLHSARESGICVELCPVSNFQTNQFMPAVDKEGSTPKPPERQYPLRELLANGNAVSLNTDNPVISNTNMIKECFQASYAFGEKGLSLWELMRILRMGFSHSFLSLPERGAMLELADQIIFDLFFDSDVVAALSCMSREN